MIILDTNVLSALMRVQPDPIVISWLDRQPAESVWTTAITVLEIRLGIELLDAGRRRRQLEEAFVHMLRDDFEGRVLPFDHAAAERAAHLAANRQRMGRPADFRDTEIIGIAIARNATLATRNIRHFQDLDVSVVDPWSDGRKSR
jgi:predicted nucleic acid-binding protein